MNYGNINEYLLTRVPELKENVEEVIRYWMPEKVPSHVLYGDTLSVYLFELLKERLNVEIVCRIFSFLEEMATCDDEEVRNLLKVSILEYLWGDYKVLGRAHKYMHAKTRKLCDELQIFFKPFIPEE